MVDFPLWLVSANVKVQLEKVAIQGCLVSSNKQPVIKKKAVNMDMIDDGSSKAALMGKIRPGDIIKKVDYHEESKKKTLCLKNITSGRPAELARLLRRPECYPVKITFQ